MYISFTWLHSARTRSCSSLDRLANSFAISTELMEAAPGDVSESFSDPSKMNKMKIEFASKCEHYTQNNNLIKR